MKRCLAAAFFLLFFHRAILMIEIYQMKAEAAEALRNAVIQTIVDEGGEPT